MARAYEGGLIMKRRRTKAEMEIARLSEKVVKAKENNNEVALKAVKKELKKHNSICGAVIASGNKICLEEPMEGRNRCEKHLNLQNAQHLQPLAPFKHGLKSSNFMAHLTEDEKEFYYGTMNEYAENYELDQLNLLALDRLLVNYLKARRLENYHTEKGTFESANAYIDFELRVQRWLETLGLNRKNTEKNQIDSNKMNSIAFLMMDDTEE